jgi:SAM-dependent methyltransferase
MTAQNIYDDPQFFAGYAQLPRSQSGLSAVYEWPAFQRLLPSSLEGLRVLDLGCGLGYFAREAIARGARSVLGVDLSQRMLDQARALGADANITYVRTALEDFVPDVSAFDLVVSSLALHYIADYRLLVQRIATGLVPGGRFAFSVEHPIFTAQGSSAWITDADGAKLHWPVDHYRNEGERRTRWFVDGVVKYHRSTETYVNGLLESGLVLARLEEPEATPAQLAEHPEWLEGRRRPPFLLMAADRPKD